MKLTLIKDEEFEDWIVDLSQATHSFKLVLEHWEASYPTVKLRMNESGLRELKELLEEELNK